MSAAALRATELIFTIATVALILINYQGFGVVAISAGSSYGKLVRGLQGR